MLQSLNRSADDDIVLHMLAMNFLANRELFCVLSLARPHHFPAYPVR